MFNWQDDERFSKDEALVLRWYPVTDTSRVVVWFTRHHGRVSTLIKGSQRPKSWVLGQYDLFYTCELLFYNRAREDLHIFKECSPMERRTGLRRNWRGCAAASHIAALLARVAPPLADCEPLYALASNCLDLLAKGETSPSLLFWFELGVLRELGHAPDLDAPKAEAHTFAYDTGRVVPGKRGPDARNAPVSGGSLAILRRLASNDSPSVFRGLRLSPEQTREIATHLNRFTAWHLDLDLPSRDIALDLMAR